MRKLSVLVLLCVILLPITALSGIQEEWVKKYDSGTYDSFSAMKVDTAGNIYVAGSSGVIKYDTNGNQLWIRNTPAVAIAVDSSGNVYLTGPTGTLKYDTSGNELWSRSAVAGFIGVDLLDNVYITSSTTATKFDTNGNQLWAVNTPGTPEYPGGFATVDETGNLYVAGTYYFPDFSYGFSVILITKYDTDGNSLWTAHGGSSGYNTYYYPNAITVDSSGNVGVTGTYYGGVSKIVTFKYDANGNSLWGTRYSSSCMPEPNAIDFDSHGSVIVTGQNGGAYVTIKSLSVNK